MRTGCKSIEVFERERAVPWGALSEHRVSVSTAGQQLAFAGYEALEQPPVSKAIRLELDMAWLVHQTTRFSAFFVRQSLGLTRQCAIGLELSA